MRLNLKKKKKEKEKKKKSLITPTHEARVMRLV